MCLLGSHHSEERHKSPFLFSFRGCILSVQAEPVCSYLHTASHTAEQISALLDEAERFCQRFPILQTAIKTQTTEEKLHLQMQTLIHLCHMIHLCWPTHAVFSRSNPPPLLSNHSDSPNHSHQPYSLCSRRMMSPCLTNSTGLEESNRSAGGRKPIMPVH